MLTVVHLKVTYFVSCYFENFFHLVFSSFTVMMMYHGVVFFVFILGFLWASWFCMLKCSPLLKSSQLFSLQILLLSNFWFCFSNYWHFILLSSSVPVTVTVSTSSYVHVWGFSCLFSLLFLIFYSTHLLSLSTCLKLPCETEILGLLPCPSHI